jgi:hypothetical protein
VHKDLVDLELVFLKRSAYSPIHKEAYSRVCPKGNRPSIQKGSSVAVGRQIYFAVLKRLDTKSKETLRVFREAADCGVYDCQHVRSMI